MEEGSANKSFHDTSTGDIPFFFVSPAKTWRHAGSTALDMTLMAKTMPCKDWAWACQERDNWRAVWLRRRRAMTRARKMFGCFRAEARPAGAHLGTKGDRPADSAYS